MKQNICDEINLHALSNGSIEEFEKLYFRYYPKAKNFLMRMLDNATDAEDLTQDAFINLWNNRQLLVNVRNLNAYIFQTVKYVLFSFVNKKKGIVKASLEEVYDLSSAENLESLIYSQELETMIDRVIDTMPRQRKLVFLMSRTEGLSISEISEKMGISKRTVETHISMALSTLRRALSALLALLLC